MNNLLYDRLQGYQQQALQLCKAYPDIYNVQFHPDLSPLGWHLGHCVYTECYWIREVFQGKPLDRISGDALYNPLWLEKSKRSRSGATNDPF